MPGGALVKIEVEKCMRPQPRDDSERYTRSSFGRFVAPLELTVDNCRPIYSLDSIDFSFTSEFARHFLQQYSRL